MEENVSVSTISKYIVLCTIICIPVFFLPITQNYFDTNKWSIYVLTALCALVLWSLRMLVKKSVVIHWSPVTLGLSVMTLSSLLTFIIISPNKIDAMTNSYGFGTLLSTLLLVLIVDPFMTHKEKSVLRDGSVILLFALSLFIIYQQTGVGKFLFPTIPYLQNPLFSPTGTPTSLILYLLLIMPWAVQSFVKAKQDNRETKTILLGVGLAVAAIALGLTLWRYIPTMKSTRLPILMGTEILTKSWQSTKTLLLGTGAEGFLWAFTKYRPVALNLTPIWLTGFSTNATLVLHMGTIYGAFAGLALLFFLGTMMTTAKGRIETIQGILFIAAACIIPPSFLFFPMIVILILGRSKNPHKTFAMPLLIGIPTAFIMGVIIILTALGLSSWYQGELFFAKAITAKEAGNGTLAYSLFRSATEKLPTNARIRNHLAQTNFLMAQAIIAASPVDLQGKPNLSDDDKKTVQQLITAAVKESKLAVTLSPDDVLIWAGMATMYQQLVGVAGDADTWSIAAYKKAMTLDPTNPVLHIDLGGLYVALKRYDEAYQEFLTAVTLKPNYANAYYNMANSFTKNGEPVKAKKALEDTKNLLDPTSAEYDKVLQELKMIK